MTAVDWNPLAKLVAFDQPPQQNKPNASGALATLQEMRNDTRLAGIFTAPGVQNTAVILRSETIRNAVLGYFEALDFSTTTEEAAEVNLRELTRVAVLLLCTISQYEVAVGGMQKHKFDFYLAHQLTFCWSLRVLVPEIPAAAGSRLFRSVWLLMVLAYLHQQLPLIKPDVLDETSLPSGPPQAEWHRARVVAIGSTKDKGYDPHFVKVLRTLWEFSLIWPEDQQRFLKAATRFEQEFVGWTGFGMEGEERMDVTM